MTKFPNDPNIDGKYNYLYKITNIINGKIYIGVHRTNNLDDGYMGSGKIIKRSIRKYGEDNFSKEILEYFPTYKEALDAERSMVTLDFINEDTNYNIKEGGYGSCGWSNEMLEHFSNIALERWKNPDYMDHMNSVYYSNPEKQKQKGLKVKKWIEDNPDQHMERMLKINKNPEKIEKMANAHRGMKRSEETKRNVSDALKLVHSDSEKSKKISGIGMKYIYNSETKTIKRVPKDSTIPNGWISGSGPKPKR